VDGEPKIYETTIAFGSETATDDVTGAITRTAPLPDAAAVDDAIRALTGPLDQMPPDYSAKQSGGVRAYDAARKGTPLVLETARVTVHRWEVLARDAASLTARIECSGGTYIRSLGRDLGRMTASAAHLSSLRRVASGRFRIEDACSLDALRAREYHVRDMREAIASMPAQTLTPDEIIRVAHGNPVPATVEGRRAALVAPTGRLLAIADRNGASWQPATVFPHD
jgi:tRNA pseudouridine55 synthase